MLVAHGKEKVYGSGVIDRTSAWLNADVEHLIPAAGGSGQEWVVQRGPQRQDGGSSGKRMLNTSLMSDSHRRLAKRLNTCWPF